MEKIKINGRTYDLVANGYQLGDDGGRIIFQPGATSFADVEVDLAAARELTVLDSTGEPMISRTDLVYAGRLTKDANYVIGADAETGTDVIGPVMIAEFRTPDVREELAAVKAQLDYVTMMSDIPMEEV
ncbi:MAG: hypothetical protein PHV18_14925 [Lachnospiraceae bacterium]|nr:hypothetical protein [Lachnospiraceae bacterium]